MVIGSAGLVPPVGGETGVLFRERDWAATSLGPIPNWSQTLRTLVDLALSAAHPAYVVWGPERTTLYNDGLIPILGSRHPDAFGRSFGDVWPEVWDDFK